MGAKLPAPASAQTATVQRHYPALEKGEIGAKPDTGAAGTAPVFFQHVPDQDLLGGKVVIQRKPPTSY
jgi:hypothetical protein